MSCTRRASFSNGLASEQSEEMNQKAHLLLFLYSVT